MVGSSSQELIIVFQGTEANQQFSTFCAICDINLLFLPTYPSMYLAGLKIDKAFSTRNINRTDSSIYSMRI